jgi:hypothetical protein
VCLISGGLCAEFKVVVAILFSNSLLLKIFSLLLQHHMAIGYLIL